MGGCGREKLFSRFFRIWLPPRKTWAFCHPLHSLCNMVNVMLSKGKPEESTGPFRQQDDVSSETERKSVSLRSAGSLATRQGIQPAADSQPGQPRLRREEGRWGFCDDARSPLPPSAAPGAGPEVVTSARACALNPGQLLPPGLQLRPAGKRWAPSPPPTKGSGLCPPPLFATWPSAPRRRPGGAKRTREPRLPPG